MTLSSFTFVCGICAAQIRIIVEDGSHEAVILPAGNLNLAAELTVQELRYNPEN